MAKNNVENKEVENNEELFVEETIIEDVVEEIEVAIWVATSTFRDTNNFNIVYNVGDEVEHTDLREKLGLIELK